MICITSLAEIQAIVRSRKEKDISKLPGTAKNKGKLGVNLQIVWHGENNTAVYSIVCSYYKYTLKCACTPKYEIIHFKVKGLRKDFQNSANNAGGV